MKRTLLGILCNAILLASATASAQSTSFNFEQFQPLPSQTTNTLGVARSEVLEHFTPSAGLLLHFQDDPLQLRDDSGTVRLMDAQLKGEVMLALGFFDFADLGVVIPMALYQTGDAAPQYGFPNAVSGFAMSDIRIVPKIRFLDIAGFGAALVVPVSLPTGDSDTFNTDGGVGAEPRLVLDWAHENGLSVAANVGYLLRPEEKSLNYATGQTLKWSGGVEVPLGSPDIRAVGTLFGSYGIADASDPANPGEVADNAKARPIEALLGLNMEFGDILVQLGGGSGLSGGVGSPDFRIYTGIHWSPRDKDSDKDGLMDSVDRCPQKPEDKDGWEDSDGCPDPDNDGDNILDSDDSCPDKAEDVDTFEDKDGCPDPDNDKDGVLDVDDQCPLEAGPKENKGCPWGDADKDGLKDNVDSCPQEPEDIDNFQDDDGCPDPDNDQDGIPDANDKCPLEPETINGNEDEDGCPDKGKSKVVVTAEKIEILDKVFFDTNKASIKGRSFNLLDQVASTLKAHPEIKTIEVQGHTDSRGKDSKNLALSKKRAAAVMKYLVDQGVDANTLVSEGYGETEPIDTNKTRKGRANNRRVEFKIIKVEGEVRVKTE